MSAGNAETRSNVDTGHDLSNCVGATETIQTARAAITAEDPKLMEAEEAVAPETDRQRSLCTDGAGGFVSSSGELLVRSSSDSSVDDFPAVPMVLEDPLSPTEVARALETVLIHDPSETVLEQSNAGNEWMSIGSVEMRGRRDQMEDAHCIKMSLDNFPDTSLIGLFDGHGGAAVSLNLARELPSLIGGLDHLSDSCLEDALIAFDQQQCEYEDMGSTCICVLVRPDPTGFELTAINIGDSRAILIHADGTCTPLSHDHKPDDLKESERIEKAGGVVMEVGGCSRVDGFLAVSRAIGDWSFKQTSTPPSEQKVCAVPDIVRMHAKASDKLLLMCDGVVEKLTNDDVAAYVHKKLTNDGVAKLNPAPAQVAGELVLHSYECGSTDNHSAILVMLGGARTSSGELERGTSE